MSSSLHHDLWISPDGTYGTDGVLLVDTSKWSEEDWIDLEEANDNDKWDLALEIGAYYNDNL
jgi:hypothetical protein